MNRSDALTKLRALSGALRAQGATSLYLFTSTERSRALAGSELDLFIDYDPRGRFNAPDLLAAKHFLEEELGVGVDLTTRSGLDPLTCDRIAAEATRVF